MRSNLYTAIKSSLSQIKFFKVALVIIFILSFGADVNAQNIKDVVVNKNSGKITIEWEKFSTVWGGNQYDVNSNETVYIKLKSEPDAAYIPILSGSQIGQGYPPSKGQHIMTYSSNYGVISYNPSAWQTAEGCCQKSNGTNDRHARMDFYGLPGKYYNADIVIKLTGGRCHFERHPDGWHNAFVHNTCSPNNINETKELLVTPIGEAGNVTASFDQNCSGVQLNWSHGTEMNHSKGYYKVLRKLANTNNSYTEVGNVNATSFLDNTAASNVEYEYKLQSGLYYSANSQIYTVSTPTTVRGRKLGLTDSPKGLFLDQANCNGHINVNWNYAGASNPPNFEIIKATDAAFSQNVTREVVSGSDRTWRDVNATSGKTYYYKVQGKASCPNNASTFTYSNFSNTENQVGNGAPPAPRITGLSTNAAAKTVTLNWTDSSALEHSYKVVRVSGSGSTEFPVAQNATSYVDNSASSCENYTYQLKAVNDQCAVSGVLSTNSKIAYIPANVAATFDATNKIEATDGEFGDKIDLKWKTLNRQNENWIITRINPITQDTAQIASPSGNTKFFSDNSANANTLYEYIVQGELNCAGNLLQSNTSKDVGFRLAFGTVNGQITYTGGVAVKGVKVTATAASGASGKSGNFNGTTSVGAIPATKSTAFETNEITTMAHIRPHSVSGLYTIVDKHNSTTGFKLEVNNRNLSFTSGALAVNAPIPNYNVNSWTAVAATANQDSITLYANGKQIGKFVNTSNMLNTVSAFQIGSNFDGELDEIRVFNRALTEQEVARSFDVYINPSMRGLIGYWRFDEGFGNIAYDYSKTLLTANKNHLTLTNVNWNNNKPSTSQLTAGAYTDSLGSYFIPFIPYLGSGDNFTITPEFGTHSFAPATTTLLIGSGSANYTGQDFTDQSSFSVSGTAQYLGARPGDTTSCFVQEGRLLIDGEVVIRNGQVAMTDGQGRFDIQVPIGPHTVSIEKTSHVFSAGRFPITGTHNFQQNIQGITFFDSTLIKVVGRVAGGSIQKSLPPALGRGKNNIGFAKIPFKSQQNNGCMVDTAITNMLTGEFEINLPPMRYEILDFTVESNSAIGFINQPSLDVSNVPPVQYSLDSIYRDTLGRKHLIRVDSVDYQLQRDFIYSVSPSIDVKGKEVPTQLGADTITYTNSGTSIKIPTAALGLTYPIVEENKEYTWNISAFEIYENRDITNQVQLDSVPMTEGVIRIQNELSNNNLVEFEYGLTDTVRFNGIQEYKFKAGQANTNADAVNPRYSYTKTAQITLLPFTGDAVYWKPNISDPTNQFFRGVVFGGRALGNSFATLGPQVVTMVLRDPPGTNSSATWESTTSVTNSYSYNVESGDASSFDTEIAMGTEFSVGLGYTTPTSIEFSAGTNNSTETSIGNGGEVIETVTNTLGISTGTTDEFVGANADLFFGRSMNMDFGLSQVLSLIDVNNCNGNCSGSIISYNGKDYKIGTTVSMFAIPKGYETEFVYTQIGIENSVIPKLESLRDQLLMNDSNYISLLPASHPRYGFSNDNLMFLNDATPDELNNTMDDSLGISYHFKGYKRRVETRTSSISNIPKVLTIYEGVDSVWWYNKQIALWETTLEENERAKVFANASNLDKNISYQGGTVISQSTTTTRSNSSTTTLNYNMSTELALAIGAEVGGIGASLQQSTGVSLSRNSTKGTTNESSTTFSYTFDDSDADDEFSVDVFKSIDGYGPIFKTRGGQTSCPYQGESVTKYYQPGLVLDKATIQLEQPGITASPLSLFNVPANGQGNITLNLSQSGPENAVFAIRIMENSNPNGAILKIDGIDPNRDFSIPARSTITKTLTIEKGPNHIAYDSIGIILISKCQYAYNTSGYDDIADTVYISVNFLPSCTDINVQAPQNQFVANNTYKNKLPIVISGYDINYGGLEKIQLQYKPSNQASWIPLGTEWFKDTNDIDTRYPNHTDPQQIPRNQSYITFNLQMDQLIDQDYDLRAISTCKIPQNPVFNQESQVVSGVFDRVNPHPFGSPTPADGVLDPNDDISIQFNEVIEAGSLTPANFQITGVLNGQELRHDKAVAFDGTTGYLEIANGFDFASGSFTIEFWAKRDVLGTKQTVISQGASANNLFNIGFDASNKIEVNVGANTYLSDFVIIDDSTWHHYTVTYNKDLLELEITDRFSNSTQTSTNTNFFSSFQSGGKTYVGKNSSNNSDFFSGSIHQLRIWNRALPQSVVGSRISQNLHGREAGLVGFWPMDEGKGALAEDKSRFRHAQMNANWEINPKSTAAAFDGVSKYAVVDSAGTLAITQEMDMSIEFWFKTTGGRLQTFLSNGSGRFISTDLNRNGWNIEMNAQNEIWVKNDSFAFKAVENNYADNKWHHFALVVNRLANTTAYIDGNQQRTVSSANFWGFGAAKLAVGARYSINGTQELFDQHFSGNMDEIRIWNTALLRENIELNRFNRMKGDEFGLLAYYPFESYRLELGVPLLDVSMANQSQILANPTRVNSRAVNGSVFTAESPSVALQRPVEKIKFSWSVNGDKIVITPNEEAANIENVTLNVSVKGIKDLHGNVMQSPKTWIAFVNKNQVLWQDVEKNLSKELNDTMTFTSKVVNSGGEVKNFTISNIPAWLTVSPSSGTINPLSSKSIKFTVNPSVNIGAYAEDVMLTTDFGFNEKLFVKLKVSKTAPNFFVDPSLYQQSMSIIGQIRINGQVSTNPDDKLVAIMNGEVRGVANLQYVPTYDKYVAFLDVYSNASDSIYFQVWNASQGQIHTDINPVLFFNNNDLVGSPANPQYFDAINNISKPIVLKSGWNWVSFPLGDSKMKSFHNFFEELNLQNGDMIKTIGNNSVAQYGGSSIGWSGNLVSEGLKNDVSYLIKMTVRDTLNYKGLAIDPDTVQINVVTGWNRVGFISLRNMQISTALANFNAQDGDIIKSQERFSYFDQNLGWIGSLQTLEPTKGYLLKSAQASSFVYPRQGLLRLRNELPAQMELEAMLSDGFNLNSYAYEAAISAIVKVEVCEEVVQNPNIVLAAFNGEELRGWSESATKVNDELGYQYFLTAYGEGDEQFEYALIDTTTNEKIALSGILVFEKNGLEGTPNKPLVIFPTSKIDCEEFNVDANTSNGLADNVVYPNPFKTTLNVSVPSDLGEAVEVSLIDSYGRVMHQEIAVQGSLLNWSRVAGSKAVAQGVYYIRFSTDNGSKVEKVVKY